MNILQLSTMKDNILSVMSVIYTEWLSLIWIELWFQCIYPSGKLFKNNIFTRTYTRPIHCHPFSQTSQWNKSISSRPVNTHPNGPSTEMSELSTLDENTGLGRTRAGPTSGVEPIQAPEKSSSQGLSWDVTQQEGGNDPVRSAGDHYSCNSDLVFSRSKHPTWQLGSRVRHIIAYELKISYSGSKHSSLSKYHPRGSNRVKIHQCNHCQ